MKSQSNYFVVVVVLVDVLVVQVSRQHVCHDFGPPPPASDLDPLMVSLIFSNIFLWP